MSEAPPPAFDVPRAIHGFFDHEEHFDYAGRSEYHYFCRYAPCVEARARSGHEPWTLRRFNIPETTEEVPYLARHVLGDLGSPSTGATHFLYDPKNRTYRCCRPVQSDGYGTGHNSDECTYVLSEDVLCAGMNPDWDSRPVNLCLWLFHHELHARVRDDALSTGLFRQMHTVCRESWDIFDQPRGLSNPVGEMVDLPILPDFLVKSSTILSKTAVPDDMAVSLTKNSDGRPQNGWNVANTLSDRNVDVVNIRCAPEIAHHDMIFGRTSVDLDEAATLEQINSLLTSLAGHRSGQKMYTDEHIGWLCRNAILYLAAQRPRTALLFSTLADRIARDMEFPPCDLCMTNETFHDAVRLATVERCPHALSLLTVDQAWRAVSRTRFIKGGKEDFIARMRRILVNLTLFNARFEGMQTETDRIGLVCDLISMPTSWRPKPRSAPWSPDYKARLSRALIDVAAITDFWPEWVSLIAHQLNVLVFNLMSSWSSARGLLQVSGTARLSETLFQLMRFQVRMDHLQTRVAQRWDGAYEVKRRPYQMFFDMGKLLESAQTELSQGLHKCFSTAFVVDAV